VVDLSILFFIIFCPFFIKNSKIFSRKNLERAKIFKKNLERQKKFQEKIWRDRKKIDKKNLKENFL